MINPKVCRKCTINYANNNPSGEGEEEDARWLKNRLENFDKILGESGTIICYSYYHNWPEMLMKDMHHADIHIDEDPPEDCMCMLEQVVMRGKNA